MKWYIEFIILYVIVFLFIFSRNANSWGYDGATLFVSAIFSLIISGVFYAGYHEVTKKKRLENASEEEKAHLKEKGKRTNKIAIGAIIFMIIFCLILVAFVLLMG